MKAFEVVSTSYDPKNRPVHLCKDKLGKFYTYKPATGYSSRTFADQEDERLKNIFERQCSCSHNNAFYEEGDRNGQLPVHLNEQEDEDEDNSK